MNRVESLYLPLTGVLALRIFLNWEKRAGVAVNTIGGFLGGNGICLS